MGEEKKLFCGKGLLAQLEEAYKPIKHKIPKVVEDIDEFGRPIKRFVPDTDFEVKIDPAFAEAFKKRREILEKSFLEELRGYKPQKNPFQNAFVPFWEEGLWPAKNKDLVISVKRKRIKFNFNN